MLHFLKKFHRDNKEIRFSNNNYLIDLLSNAYNPLSKVTASRGSGWDKKEEIWLFNVRNNWRCSEYISNPCSIKISEDTVLYAEENGKPISFKYTIKSKLKWYYKECGCKEWNVDLSDTPYQENCSENEYEEHEINRTITLSPNDKNNPKYKLSCSLLTSRKLILFNLFFKTPFIFYCFVFRRN